MDTKQEFYSPQNDSHFNNPYIDKEEWRNTPVDHLYVHGGFEGTNTRFSFYFPLAENYQGRFFHIVTPVQGHEDASQNASADEDNIGFAIDHGAYFVESNMGGNDPDYTMLYRSSAAVAVYSKQVANRLFGEHSPFGYIYGGSGGAYKTIACVQNTQGVWAGAVPFVMANPMAIPNVFTVRVHAMRILRDRFPQIIDALEPGGSGDMYAGLNEEEADALKEATRMGFPPRAWFSHDQIGAGALPVLTYAIDEMDSEYYTDFWTKPGYLGSDPNGSAARDRFIFQSTVKSVTLPQSAYQTTDLGVDEAWQTKAYRYESKPQIELMNIPDAPAYLDGMKVCITSGQAQGHKFPLEKLAGNSVTLGISFNGGDITGILSLIQPGDSVTLDNSDYLALQTYHRHQVPSKEFIGWDQFRGENGEPIYPQRSIKIGPITAYTGAGSVQNGQFSGKMITLVSLLDESAFPCLPDWYRKQVQKVYGDKSDSKFRYWCSENAMHGGEYDPERSLHIVSYRGTLHQALLDLSDWVERGIEPAQSSLYRIVDAQVEIPYSVQERKGIQPTVTLSVNGGETARISVDETLLFEGIIEVPPNTGIVSFAVFDFDGSGAYASIAELQYLNEEKTRARVTMQHTFKQQGTFFPVLRVASNRDSKIIDPYTQVKNLARVRVVVQ